MFRQLSIAFTDRDSFAREYRRNLANGGTFVPTRESFEPREVVEVEMDLQFCGRCVTLQAEVVSCVAPKLAEAGGRPGAAVQFLVPAEELRELLGGIAGIAPPPPPPSPWPGREGPARVAERCRASLHVRIEGKNFVHRGCTRDLSRTGVLVASDGGALPVGDRVRIALAHPTREEDVELQGEVARHVKAEGRVVAMGIHFLLGKDAKSQQRQLDDLRAAAHAQLLGSIRGPVAALGLANLLQMLGSSAREGTLFVACGDEEGRLAFENGTLRHASVGPVVGMKALARVMTWDEGEFWFLPDVPPDEPRSEGIPIYGAILEAVTQTDELKRLDLRDLPTSAQLSRNPQAPRLEEPSKLERRLLELATTPMTVATLLDAVQASDLEVFQALLSLLEQDQLCVGEP